MWIEKLVEFDVIFLYYSIYHGGDFANMLRDGMYNISADFRFNACVRLGVCVCQKLLCSLVMSHVNVCLFVCIRIRTYVLLNI